MILDVAFLFEDDVAEFKVKVLKSVNNGGGEEHQAIENVLERPEMKYFGEQNVL